MISESDLRLLASDLPIESAPPIASGDLALEEAYRSIIAGIVSDGEVGDRTEYGHYGSGSASYVDSWLYFKDGRCRLSPNEEHHTGLILLLSRLSCYYALGEGEASWHGRGGARYMPALDLIDNIRDGHLVQLGGRVEAALEKAGLTRIRREALAQAAPVDLLVPTILADPPFTVFDVLFHWED